MRLLNNSRGWVLTAAATMVLASGAGAQDLGIAVGAAAPGAAVQTLAGRAVNLSQYIGKSPVVLEFWATWCPNCHELEPALLAAYRRYGRQVKFVGVAVSVNESPDRVKVYAERHHLAHDIVYDRTGAATDAYDVPATSYVVVINKAGRVVYTGLGGRQDIEAAIRRAM